MAKTFLLTGSAGFIGFHVATRLLSQGHSVVGLDNLNDYYEVSLKNARNELLKKQKNYKFHFVDLADAKAVGEIFKTNQFDSVIHLAAQAGVRYSLENPGVYLKSNVEGTVNILEGIRHSEGKKPHLLMASSSSVYGLSPKYPYSEDDVADKPVSFYGATKRSVEIMAHSYAHLFNLRITALRYFTVYGPWGRPDMAPFKFVSRILKGDEIEVYNNGDMIRDFTFIDDIVDGTLSLEAVRANPELPGYDVFNIGCSQPRALLDFIKAMESAVGKPAKLKMMPFQAGDVYKTHADVTKIKKLCGYSPKVSMEEGVARFVKWYRDFYKV